MGKRKQWLPASDGEGLESREERIRQAKRRLDEGFYSGENGAELIANSLVSLVMDKFYSEIN